MASLAMRIRDDGDFEAMPILADALEDAGCTEAAILEHIPGPGQHVRECWVLDALIVSKSLTQPFALINSARTS